MRHLRDMKAPMPPRPPRPRPDRGPARLRRQFESFRRAVPRLGSWIHWLQARRARLFRVPLAILLVVGGLFSFLPLLGIWMLPLGLMLLAVDLPFLQGPVTRLIIRARIKLRQWRRARRR
jgi:hypothetical protein